MTEEDEPADAEELETEVEVENICKKEGSGSQHGGKAATLQTKQHFEAAGTVCQLPMEFCRR